MGIVNGRLGKGAAKALHVAAKLPWPPILKGLAYGAIIIGGAYGVSRVVDTIRNNDDEEEKQHREYTASERRISTLEEDKKNIFLYSSHLMILVDINCQNLNLCNSLKEQSRKEIAVDNIILQAKDILRTI
ncbi:MAG: hypothetical protein QXF76_01280 [Candidatus Anstonellales archaeon]